jgi:hypothetical protein
MSAKIWLPSRDLHYLPQQMIAQDPAQVPQKLSLPSCHRCTRPAHRTLQPRILALACVTLIAISPTTHYLRVTSVLWTVIYPSVPDLSKAAIDTCSKHTWEKR